MAARDVDTYLTGFTSLPVTGGIVKRPPYEAIKEPTSKPEVVAASA